MKIFNQKSIKELSEERKQEEGRDNAAKSLASELAITKVNLMKKDNIVKELTTEMANLKLELMQIKGGVK